MLPAQNAPEDLFGLDPILKRDHTGVGADQRGNGACGAFRVPHLDAEHHDIDRADLSRIGDCLDRIDAEITEPALHSKTALSHGLEMAPASYEMNVLAMLREAATEVTADTTGTHHGYP